MIDLSGIFREVYLYSVPRVHLHDVEVRTSLDAARTRRPERPCAGARPRAGGAAGVYTVSGTLYDAEGREVEAGSLSGSVEPPASGTAAVELTGKVRGPELWSAESPSLYTLVLSVRAPGGGRTEIQRVRFGFREITFGPGALRSTAGPSY